MARARNVNLLLQLSVSINDDRMGLGKATRGTAFQRHRAGRKESRQSAPEKIDDEGTEEIQCPTILIRSGQQA